MWSVNSWESINHLLSRAMWLDQWVVNVIFEGEGEHIFQLAVRSLVAFVRFWGRFGVLVMSLWCFNFLVVEDFLRFYRDDGVHMFFCIFVSGWHAILRVLCFMDSMWVAFIPHFLPIYGYISDFVYFLIIGFCHIVVNELGSTGWTIFFF